MPFGNVDQNTSWKSTISSYSMKHKMVGKFSQTPLSPRQVYQHLQVNRIHYRMLQNLHIFYLVTERKLDWAGSLLFSMDLSIRQGCHTKA